jgi:ATP-dependent DNA ligase
VTLPLSPPIEPQLAKTATEFPSEGTWLYEPKWDGFRVIAFVDGDEVFLQSRNGKPLDRYFPELSLPPGRYVLDGEIVIDPGDGSQDFGALQQRIHPAASRVELLARETPASIVAFDLLADGDDVLLELPFGDRRAALERLLANAGGAHSVTLTPQERTAEGARRWLGTAEGVIAKQADAPYLPGKRTGMLKLRQRRTLDCVICGYRPGKAPDSVGSLILALYNGDALVVVGHCSAFTTKEKRELLDRVRPYETGERGSGEPSRWTAGRDLEWVELRPEMVVEVSYDHMSDGRIRHGTRVVRWRDDRDPKSCSIDQLV